MRLVKSTILSTTMLATGITAAQAEVNVVASIKPVHSLVAGVMAGVGTPSLIIEGAGSPHNYALKPSQARQLQDADLVFWMSHDLEAFLEKSIEGIATKAKSVPLMDSHGLTKLKFREGGAFEAHAHDDHDDHAKEEHKDHGHDDHDDHAKEEHKDHGHDDHGHDGFDPHVWLDPVNAKAMVHEIEEALSAADPENAATYEANAKNIMAKLDNLVAEISAELEPVKGIGFIVFHDAYQYFETRFGVAAVGSITVSPEVLPGAQRISELQAKINSMHTTCVFSEPQFEPKLVSTIIDNTQSRTGVLDPLGASIGNGPKLYFTLIRNMAHSIKDCLADQG
ncbi:MAG: zinc ABC transporter substrate-binding protein ZnuA [Gammaproteobacteria bacterium]|nr:zinc ABC transporter substrate-binding protein ZnuA [Gammaproteobacteria bacterium]